MPDIINYGDAIEGAKINGSSRFVLVNRGLVGKKNGDKYFRFIASFNVDAQIVAAAKKLILSLSAHMVVGSKLLCDKAIIESFSNTASCAVNSKSHTHKANFWKFSKQTMVRIDLPHNEIKNAIIKRLSIDPPQIQ